MFHSTLLSQYGFSAQLPVQAKTRGKGWMAGLIKADCIDNFYSSDPTGLFCDLLRGNRRGDALSKGGKERKKLHNTIS